MKNLRSLIALAMCAFLALAGCTKKSSSSGSGSSSSSNSMTATAGGTAFSASGTSVVASVNGDILAVAGVTPANASITLNIIQYANGTGTFQCDGTHATILYGPAPGTALGGSHGVITLTSISPNFEGTFSFTCNDSTKVTSGTFLVKAP